MGALQIYIDDDDDDHGRIVVPSPSGRLPSCRSRATGSLIAGIWCRRHVNCIALGFFGRLAHGVRVRPPLFHSRLCVVRTLCNPVCGRLIYRVAHLAFVDPQS